MSLSGLKPVCEIQFEGFIYPAMNQIITQAARIISRWNNDITLNLVIRVPVGGGIRAVEHHSESNEAYFAHTPGLHIAFPSCPTDAAAMPKYSCGLGSPVIFFEPKRLYWKRKQQPREAAEPATPLSARVVRNGSDITVVGFGVLEVLAAADRVATAIDVEVVDLRWIAPWIPTRYSSRWPEPVACWSYTRRSVSAAWEPKSLRRWPSPALIT